MSMLSVFNLATNLNENAGKLSSISDVEAYKFVGELSEATMESQCAILEEAADIFEYQSVTDDIMTEAAITDPSKLEAISESVIDTLKTKVMGFINKIIAMLKGLMEKIKVFFLKFTGKADKWAKAMKDPIAKAKGRTGITNLAVEMHRWDTEYVITTLPNAAGAAADQYNKKKLDKDVADNLAKVAAIKPDAALNKQGGDDPDVKNKIEALKNATEALKGEMENSKEHTMGEVKKLLGIGSSSANDMEGLYRDVTLKATCGEVTTIKFSELKPEDMLAAVEKSGTYLKKLEENYQKALTKMEEVKASAEKAFANGSKISAKLKNMPEGVVTAYNAYLSAYSSVTTSDISFVHNVFSGLQNRAKGYIEGMTSDYMRALTKYANFKGEAA